MKFVAKIAFGFAIVAVSTVNAQETVAPTPIAEAPVMINSAPVMTTTPVYSAPMQTGPRVRRSASSSSSVFGRMMELERRKNAWLRRTFLGR